MLRATTSINTFSALSYQGTWNASTNTPTLTSSVGTAGYYYIVSVAGSTSLNGISTWNVGDWVIFSNTGVWQRIAGGVTGSINIVNNTTSSTPYYVTLSNASSGTIATEYVDTSGLTFVPSTGTLTSTIMNVTGDGTNGTLILNPTGNGGIAIDSGQGMNVSCYDSVNPDSGVYNYRYGQDFGYHYFALSTTNTKFDAGNVTFALGQYGQIGLGPTAYNNFFANINFGTAGQVLTSGGSGASATWSNIKTPATTYSGLGSASTAGAGARGFITDSTTATFLATAAGGGSNAVPVVSNGTNWLVG